MRFLHVNPQRSMTRLKASILESLAAILAVACVALIIVAALMLAAQCFVWLRYGYWEPYSVSNLLVDLKLGLPGKPRVPILRQPIGLLAALPASACLAGIAGLCFIAGRLLTDLAGPRESRSR
jgi:hypothetical protein